MACFRGFAASPPGLPHRVLAAGVGRVSPVCDRRHARLSAWARHRASGPQTRPCPIARRWHGRPRRSRRGRPRRRRSAGRPGGRRRAGLGGAGAMGRGGARARRRSLVARPPCPLAERPSGAWSSPLASGGAGSPVPFAGPGRPADSGRVPFGLVHKLAICSRIGCAITEGEGATRRPRSVPPKAPVLCSCPLPASSWWTTSRKIATFSCGGCGVCS